MAHPLKPRTDILPPAQQEIWQDLAPAPTLSFVLYGGTAVALHLGHRVSVDFDFFNAAPLDKDRLATSFSFMRRARTIQEGENTLVAAVDTPSGPVRLSFFGAVTIGRIQRSTSYRRFDTARRLARRSAGDEAESDTRPCGGQGLPRHFCDAFRERVAGEGIGRFRRNVWQGPQPRAESDRVFQGWRFVLVAREASEHPSRSKRPRVGNSANSARPRVARRRAVKRHSGASEVLVTEFFRRNGSKTHRRARPERARPMPVTSTRVRDGGGAA